MSLPAEGDGADFYLFAQAHLAPYRCWRAFLLSVFLHAVVIASLPSLLSLLPEDDEAAWRRTAFRIRPLELHIDDRLYLPRSAPGGGREEAPRPAKPTPAREKPPAPAAKPAPRRFELPQIARRVDADQTILQPQFPPNLALEKQMRLPNVMFWSARARLPKPEPKRFLRPGRAPSTPPSIPSLDVPPRLELPNQEVTAATLKVSGVPFSERPKLPMPQGTTAPVRVFRPPTPGSQPGISVDAIIGEPVNLIALSSNPAGPARVLVVPPGNQLGRLPGPPGEGESGEGASGGAGTVSGTGAHESAGAASAGKEAAGMGRGAGSASGGRGSAGAGAGAGGTGSGAGHGPGSGTGAGSGAGGAGSQGGGMGQVYAMGAGIPSSVAVRIAEPDRSVADIVVQSSESGVLPEAARLLSGQPVYTVYLNLATRKEWILQYAKPQAAGRSATVRGSVVTLGAEAPVKAPYLLVRATPPVTLEQRSTYILIHGMLDATGRFRDLSMVDESDAPLADLILPYLQRWEFRPGTQDGRPVPLEILLVIPPSRG